MTQIKLSSVLSAADLSIFDNIEVENIRFEENKMVLELADESEVEVADQDIDLEGGCAVVHAADARLEGGATFAADMEFRIKRQLTVEDVVSYERDRHLPG